MSGSTTSPKVFISYCWTTPPHEDWVIEFATRLMGDGVDVILDKWNLKPGQDKYAFMEKMVTDPNVNKVLVICDSGYKRKADAREGGVGTESQIISKEIYEKVDQQKFIPIIRECDEKGEACIPVLLSSRTYIDLSADEVDSNYEEEYKKLIATLYNKSIYPKPPLGTPPPFILEEEPKTIKTGHKFQEIKNYALKKGSITEASISDYLETFLTSLDVLVPT